MTKTYKPEFDKLHIHYPVQERNKEAEWWYFDAALDNGDHFVVMYSVNDTRLYPRQPSVRVDLYEKDGTEHSLIKKYPEEKASFSRKQCDVNYNDEQWCKDCGDHYEMKAFIDGYGAYLKFYAKVPSWQAGTDGCVFKNPQTGEEKAWVVAQPMASVEGVLYKNDKEITVKGQGYHDHNWMNLNVGNELDHWHWGKVHTEDITIDYGILIPSIPGAKPAVTMLVEDAENLYTEPNDLHHQAGNITYELLDIETEPELGFSFAHRFMIHVKTPDIKLDLEVNVDHIVMKSLCDDLPTGGESAYRFIGDEVLTVQKNTEKEKVYRTSSLHEIVFPHAPKEADAK
ncbi:MAG: lipocalin-like domain-containing protein [Eubacteriales bacterium]|nr:lipocalin-like domain-containing protein [Eubacteriales bacterium]